MLDLLVRRQRTAERVAAEGPVEGEVEHDLGCTDHLRALHHAGELQLALDVGGGVAGLADRRARRRDAHAVELDARVAPHEVDAPQRRDGDARRVGGEEELGGTGVGRRGDEQLVGLGARLDR